MKRAHIIVMIIAGATSATRARMVVLIDSGTNGKEMERSRSEKGRRVDLMKLRPPPTAAITL